MQNERGAALIVVLMLLVLLGAIALGVSLIAMTDLMTAANFRENQQAMYLAEAAAARAAADLDRLSDWTPVLAGAARSSFVDGEPGGTRSLASGEEIDLDEIRSLANCGKAACTGVDLVAVTAERPWGPNNPTFHLFAYGKVSDLLQTDSAGAFYLVVMVADDPSETDGDPLRDAAGAVDPGRGVALIRAEAFGPRGSRRGVEMVVARSGGPSPEQGYSGQLAGGETNEHRSGRPVGTPRSTLGWRRIGG
ncbi:MAG: PilX N-terminal domain-containing pilus assembly protein [Vicinamibacterales bacterium]